VAGNGEALLNGIFLTCAVTGNHTTRQQHPRLPVSPNEIAEASLEAAETGAAAVHIHVRNPADGRPSMEVELYADVVAQIRRSDPLLVINLTTGPGGRFHPSDHDPLVPGPRTNLLSPERRVEHIQALCPDIATLDLNTMTFGGEVVINTPENVRRMAAVMYPIGVRPEFELFDSGDVLLLRDLIADGAVPAAPLCSLVLGIRYGFPPTTEALLYARSLLPADAIWTGFGVGKSAFPLLAQSILAGGNVRIGLEDCVYLSKGQLTPSNAALVAKAKRMVEDLGLTLANAAEMRRQLGLRPTNAFQSRSSASS
jgi:uncharacterized protein (DUF849 family)